MRSKLEQDVIGIKSPLVWVPIVYIMLLLLSIWISDPEEPKHITVYNETALLPMIPMLCALLLQREIGGGAMEMLAAYPVSLGGMALRKWVLTLAAAAMLQAAVMSAYGLHFGGRQTVLYSYAGLPPVKAEAGIGQLLLQALPAYAALASICMFVMLLTKKTYGGLIAAYAVWMAEMLSGGELLSGAVLITGHIPKEISFVQNRLILTAAAAALLLASCLAAERRSRWIIAEDTE